MAYGQNSNLSLQDTSATLACWRYPPLSMETLILLLFVIINVTAGPPTHVHQRQYGLNKERLEDGFLAHHNPNGQHDIKYDHNAILGSKQEAEEFEKLEPEEAKRRLSILVRKRMDTNGDGFLQRDELTAWIRKSFETLTLEEANEEFLDADTDQDGRVSWKEHLKEFYDDEDPTKISADDSLREDKELWMAADKDGDSKLNREEYISFYSPEEFVHMHKILYQQAMRGRDYDRDGRISMDEFLTDSNKQPLEPKSERYITEKQDFQTTYDKDKNGFLDYDEIMSWVSPTDIEIAEDETQHIIEMSDDDKDGRLSLDEVLTHHDVFVGSDATDMGAHLHDSRYIDEL